MPFPRWVPSGIMFAFALPGFTGAAADPPESATHYQDTIRPVLTEYCGKCHGPDSHEQHVDFLNSKDSDDIALARGIWASVAEQLHNRTMPPGDAPQPSEEQRLQVSQWITKLLEQTACNSGDFAGRPVPRRLNRDQYTYAVKDLTGVDFDFVETFPADGSGGEGFNNNGETLFLPPLLMERYLEVAQRILDQIIVTEPFDVTYVAEIEKGRDFHFVPKGAGNSEGDVFLPPGATVGLLLPVYVDDDFGFALKATHGTEQTQTMVLRIDSLPAKNLEIPAAPKAKARWTQIHFSRGAHLIELKVPTDGVPIKIEWMRLHQEDGDKNDRRRRQEATDRLLAEGKDWIGKDNSKAAREILRQFARRAWRRPIQEQEIKKLTSLFDRGRLRGEPFRQAIKLPLKAILVSPNFLFMTEQSNRQPGIHRISDLELATRLSFFLWHSLPDDELLQLATENKLHQPGVLGSQLKRMLSDQRSYRFATAFAGQWLGTVAVGNSKIPDTNFFKPAYTSELVTDLRRQVGETMHWMLRNNRPMTEWLDCDYVIVNKRLAKHYQIEPIPLSMTKFECITLDKNSPRPGIVGLGAVHMLTSYSRRTSPVLRGGWVLETVFGTRLPPPPPNAGNLPGGDKEVAATTVRERLEQHRQNAACAACHDLTDPIGFAMENFDVLGRWRTQEGKNQIDAVGKLPSGETFDGPLELRRVLVHRQHDFRQEMCRRMLGYALGRSLEDADACTVAKLTKRLTENGDRMVELVLGIAESIPFQYRQGTPEVRKSAS